jgi:phosphoribosylformylglycinamidine synthase
MKKFKIIVKLKDGVLDPQGETVRRAIEHLGYSGIKEVRIGKYVEISTENQVSSQEIEEIADRLLANPVIETFEVFAEE